MIKPRMKHTVKTQNVIYFLKVIQRHNLLSRSL